MDIFTVGSDRVLAGGTPDDIMAGSAGHGVGRSIPYQEDAVASQPAVNRVCPGAGVDAIPSRPAEDHVGAGAPKGAVPSGAAIDGVGILTAAERVTFGAAADSVITATGGDVVVSRPAENEIRAGQRVNHIVPAETADRVGERGAAQVVVATRAVHHIPRAGWSPYHETRRHQPRGRDPRQCLHSAHVPNPISLGLSPQNDQLQVSYPLRRDANPIC
jgi:hypothetical protein